MQTAVNTEKELLAKQEAHRHFVEQQLVHRIFVTAAVQNGDPSEALKTHVSIQLKCV